MAGLVADRSCPPASAEPGPPVKPADARRTEGKEAKPSAVVAKAPAESPRTVQAASDSKPARSPEDLAYDALANDYARIAWLDRVFENVSRVVAPAVVHIEAIKEVARGNQRMVRSQETGSGFIVRHPSNSRMYVLTNHHVVQGSSVSAIRIFLFDGRILQPTEYWLDPKADVAVLALNRDDLPSVRLGDSDQAPVGTWVLAIGSPFGLKHSVTHGIISARGRHKDELHEEGVENQDFLQTDAAINPGNSGGPLVNLKGEVVAINTAIATNHGGSEGVGFSIPINLARWIMDQLIRSGKVARGGIGVELEDVEPEILAAVGLDRPRGARVLSVHDESPAEVAGVRDGDVILRFNDITVDNLNHLINLVSMSPIGDEAELLLWRDRSSHQVRVTIADLDVMRGKVARLVNQRPKTSDGYVRRPAPAPSQPPASERNAQTIGPRAEASTPATRRLP